MVDLRPQIEHIDLEIGHDGPKTFKLDTPHL